MNSFCVTISRFFVLLCLPTFNAIAQSQSVTPGAHEAEVNEWHEKRVASLTQPVGWLSLVALDWLKEGKNTIESAGVVALEKESLSFEPRPDVKATLRGQPFKGGVVKVGSDRIEVGSRVFTIIKRSDRFAVRMWDKEAESLKKFKGINRFPVSLKWRIEARWEQYKEPKPIKVASVIPGYMDDYTVPGVAVFSLNGKEYKLEPVTSGPTSLFVIFGDETNDHDTYGSGRFLYTELPKNGTLIIDFNKAHNPPCAFSAYATCPLPPESNHLAVRIEAGEKKYGDH